MRDIVRLFAQDVAENFEIQEPLVEIGARAAEGQEAEGGQKTQDEARHRADERQW